ncbi:Adenosylcobinamide-phosphate synthase [hydrothermal vent metagenome]|uniref:Adenosylcobinamide-phosphate synthase n=1 Tax=hydrothermal vent metagenome TaxID=652676 RepID=A0A3B1CZ76_9ZZZZ
MNPALLSSAFGLDLLLGDPLWLPHPVRLMGRGIVRLETLLRRGFVPLIGEKLAGCLLLATLVFFAFATTYFLIVIGTWMHPVLGTALILYFSYTCLASKSLGDAARGVSNALSSASLPLARRRLSHIVSRETQDLSEKAVICATVETVAENTSDGIVAPLLYLALGGPALAMAYKAVNTLDSMVGYRSPRYRDFGWASAKCDDWANYLPARMTGFLMCISASLQSGRGLQALKIMRRDGEKHDSPNAGKAEAAMAGALGMQLGGPNFYKGVLKEKPWLGNAEKKPEIAQIQSSIRIMRSTAMLMCFLTVAILTFVRWSF